jgi:hypothetical protein
MRKFPYEQLLKELLMLTGVSATAAKRAAQGRLEDNLLSLAKIGDYANQQGQVPGPRVQLSKP